MLTDVWQRQNKQCVYNIKNTKTKTGERVVQTTLYSSCYISANVGVKTITLDVKHQPTFKEFVPICSWGELGALMP